MRRTIDFPDWLEPMAATLTHHRFTGPEWLFERKYDGIRLITYRQGRTVRLLSRNKLPQHHPAIEAAVLALPVREVILDGEVAWHGGTDYYVFDILWLDGENVTHRPLHERRTVLSRLPIEAPLQRVAEINEPNPWERACAEGWEGVIAKRTTSPYVPGARSRDWLKLKLQYRAEFVVGGWTEPRNTRPYVGALLLGYYDREGNLHYVGHMGGGFTREGLAAMYEQLAPLERKTPPFVDPPKTNEPAHWVAPKVVVEVKFAEWTADGKLRQPIFLGIRDDKDARDVGLEGKSLQEWAAAMRRFGASRRGGRP
jgi:bifunctional non-homologous end joining protein LigD